MIVIFLTSEDLYEYRVRRDGDGDVNGRINLFKTTYRQKLNNLWRKYEPKNTNN